MLRRFWHRLVSLFRASAAPETSRLIVGSTGSGKSEGELVDLVRLAHDRDHAVVLLDGHGPLAFAAAGHWTARGHQQRLIYEPLDATDRVLCWEMLPRSIATDPLRRLLDDAETREDVAQCFYTQRNLATLNDRPLTREWLEAAIALGQAQPQAEPLPSLLAAFRVGSTEYERLLGACDDAGVVAKFRELERLRRRNAVQYEIQTGASRRLLELVCSSEVVRQRSRPGTFDWSEALSQRKLIAFDGGGLRSKELKRTMFLLVSLAVTNAVRRHFAQTQQPLPVVLVLEEAGALGLVAPFVLAALQELRKAGLAIHLITQSSLDFADPAAFEALLANTPCQAFYQCLSPADQDIGARVFANATFDPLGVHFTRTRTAHAGVERVATESRGESFDAYGRHTGRDRRSGTALVPRSHEVQEPHYQPPNLQEQLYRTRLATLGVGERLVRDRRGVRRERVKRLRPPRGQGRFEERTREVIARVRLQPIYLPPAPVIPVASGATSPDAAARLRDEHAAGGM